MKSIIHTLFVVLISIPAYSQDLIVTNEGDSINCQVIKKRSDYIYFKFKNIDKVQSTLLPMNRVRSYQYDYYQFSEIQEASIDLDIEDKEYTPVRFAFQGGYSYRVAKIHESIPPELKDYANGLKSGFNFGADFTYFLSETIGFGMKYNFFNSSNKIDDVWVLDFRGNRRFGELSDDIKISFIGPSFSSRTQSYDKNHVLLTNIALGYLSYKNDAVLIDDIEIKGSTVGIVADLGYDGKIADNLFLGAQISFLVGALSEYDVSNGLTQRTVSLDDDDKDNLSRLDLSVGIRFHF